MNNLTDAKPLPLDAHEALKAICTTGKGRCWHCDAKLPKARRAIREGWDVQRIDHYPVASIILVCPVCLGGQAAGQREQVPDPGRKGLTERIQREELHAPVALAPRETKAATRLGSRVPNSSGRQEKREAWRIDG